MAIDMVIGIVAEHMGLGMATDIAANTTVVAAADHNVVTVISMDLHRMVAIRHTGFHSTRFGSFTNILDFDNRCSYLILIFILQL